MFFFFGDSSKKLIYFKICFFIQWIEISLFLIIIWFSIIIFNFKLKIEDDYRKSNDNQKQRYFYPLNEETNFKINKFFRTITKEKKQSLMTLNVKGRDFKIENFYEGIARFDFNDLCDQHLGAPKCWSQRSLKSNLAIPS